MQSLFLGAKGPVSATYLSVAGGGGGGAYIGGGGGAGGYLTGTTTLTRGTNYTVTVGGGGAGGVTPTTQPTSGTNSQFAGLTSPSTCEISPQTTAS